MHRRQSLVEYFNLGGPRASETSDSRGISIPDFVMNLRNSNIDLQLVVILWIWLEFVEVSHASIQDDNL